MTTEMIVTLTILAGTAICFMIGKIRSDLVAICSLILLVLLQILTPNEALSGFANSVVIMMIGLFIVGGGIFQTGLAKMASGKLLKLAGNSELRLFITVMLVTAGIGAFVSNTGTVAVMLPIVVSMAMSARINPSRLLMPLAFASSLGGMLTLIGTPPNLVINEALIHAGYEGLSFFSFTPIGIIVITVGTLSLIFLSRLFLRKDSTNQEEEQQNGQSVKQLAEKYQLAQNLFRVQVNTDSLVINKTLQELNIPAAFELSIIEIRRKTSHKNPFFKTISQEIAGPTTTLHENDIIYVFGSFEQVQKLAEAYHLELIDRNVTERMNGMNTETYAYNEVGIAEVLLTPTSKLIHEKIKHSGFREKYNLNILGIQRKDEYILHNLKEEKIRFGDALLVQGAWKQIGLLSREPSDFVVVGQPLEEANKVTLDHKAPIAAGIMVLMVLLMIFEVFPAVISVMIAAVLMVVTGCLRSMDEAYKTINWGSIVLIAGMIPMSNAIEKTGLATLLSESLVNGLGGYGPLVLLAGVYFMTSTLTMFISNTASAVLFAPIALTAAIQMGVSPYPYLFAVAIAASMSFTTPFSTPPNAMVMSAGRYKFTDYIKVGLPLQTIIGIVMIIALPLLFPF